MSQSHLLSVMHSPRCPPMSGDEKYLLHAASLAQADDRPLAETALGTALLSAQRAGCALGPLADLATLFAEARLFLRGRLPPRSDQAIAEAVEPRRPSASAEPIH
jgi:hypothetical protein